MFVTGPVLSLFILVHLLKPDVYAEMLQTGKIKVAKRFGVWFSSVAM